MQDIQRLKYYYNRCDPGRAIPADDPNGFYVDFDAEGLRGGRCIDALADTIELSDSPTYQLFTGFSGSGKTSELYRLVERLEELDYFVVYADAAEAIDLQNPINFPDVLISLGLAVEQAIDKAADRGKIHRWVRRFGGEVQNLLFSHVKVKEFKAKAGFGDADIELGLELKGNRVFRAALTEAAYDKRRQFLDQARSFFDDAQKYVRGEGWTGGLVLVLDNLEKLLATDDVRDSYRNMFVGHVDALRTPGCHLIYTVPVQLVFSSVGLQLRRLYDGAPMVLPMVKVRDRVTGDAYGPGREALVEVLRRRLGFEEVFGGDEELAGRLVDCCGGYVRDLLRLVQYAITFARQGQRRGLEELPLTDDYLDRAVSELKRGYLDAYSTKYGPLLRHIHAERPHIIPDELSEHLEDLVVGHSVMVYRNEKHWHDVHPLVRELMG